MYLIYTDIIHTHIDISSFPLLDPSKTPTTSASPLTLSGGELFPFTSETPETADPLRQIFFESDPIEFLIYKIFTHYQKTWQQWQENKPGVFALDACGETPVREDHMFLREQNEDTKPPSSVTALSRHEEFMDGAKDAIVMQLQHHCIRLVHSGDMSKRRETCKTKKATQERKICLSKIK